MTRISAWRLLAAATWVGLALPAFAQSSPPLPSMPLPPSASDPAPSETAKPKARKPATRPRRSTDAAAPDAPAGSAAKPSTRPRKSGSAAASQTYDRPSRFVPEEFDRGGGGDPSRAKPFVSETGRPGVGMRF